MGRREIDKRDSCLYFKKDINLIGRVTSLQLVWEGSIPSYPIFGYSQVGKASKFEFDKRGFDSLYPNIIINKIWNN